MLSKINTYKLPMSIGLLMIFYIVGLLGMLFSDQPDEFAQLSWLNLLISGAVLFLNHEKWSAKLLLALVSIGILGYLVEVVGVQTGMIFGEYQYGEALGYKLGGVPLIIGLNWVMLCYFSVFTFSRWIKPWWLISSVAAMSLVGLDLIIEPVAIKLDFWTWGSKDIPIQNFIAWFLIAAVFNKLITLTKEESANKLAPYLFLIQTLFFLTLRITL